MGDRGNVFVVEQYSSEAKVEGAPPRGIYLYTHWSGSDLPATVAAALQRGRDRWDDGAYLTRIIFDEMTGGDRGTTGFGIALSPPDNEHPIITVDPRNMTVERDGKTWSMADFVTAVPTIGTDEGE